MSAPHVIICDNPSADRQLPQPGPMCGCIIPRDCLHREPYASRPPFSARRDGTDHRLHSEPVDNPSLQAKGHYASPGGADATRCKCSTAYYSMISACAICQFGQDMTFVFFLRRCIDDGLMAIFWPDSPNGLQIAPRVLTSARNIGFGASY